MELAADVFVSLSKDQNEFSADEVVHMLELISKT